MTAFGHKQPILAPTDCGHSTACFRPKQVRATSDSRSEVTIPSILPGRRYETSELECHTWKHRNPRGSARAVGQERRLPIAVLVGRKEMLRSLQSWATAQRLGRGARSLAVYAPA